MGESRSEVLKESQRKGVVAAVMTGGAVAAGVLVGPITCVAAAVPAAVLTYRWWKHRSENGIKF
jgi:uncharacterized membrane protein